MKKKINIENYEAYLLDMAEGTINENDRAELILFLQEHPEIEWEIDDLPQLDGEALTLSNTFKLSLEKDQESGLSKMDHMMIASIEGVNTKSKDQELLKLIHSDEKLQKDWSYYQRTVLPMEDIVFEEKETLLKKEGKVVYLWAYAASIAAAILALFFFNLPNDQAYSPRENGFSQIEVPDTKPNYAFVIASDSVEEEKSNSRKSREIPNSKSQEAQFADKRSSNEEEVPEGRVKESDPLAPEMNNNDLVAEQKGQVNEEEKKVNEDFKTPEDDLAESIQNEEATQEGVTKTQTPNNKSLSPFEYARKLVKEDVLKNKTLTENLIDGVADITNDKVKIEKKEKSPQFALNIGKLKITKK